MCKIKLREKRSINKGYQQKSYGFPVKRYCQALDLVNDEVLIQQYIQHHQENCHWSEIREGIRSVGILEMEIYTLGTKLFMVVETPLDFEWDSAFKELAKLPLQLEWEKMMSAFQCINGIKSDEKWELMDRIFYLYE